MKKFCTNTLIGASVVFVVALLIGLIVLVYSMIYDTITITTFPETTSPYVLVYTDTYFNCEIVYDKDTKVMYSISNGTYNRGTLTVLLNADGTPKIWEGDE
jgi:hypothetical protein